MELGRDSDTGGQVTFWQQYLICKIIFMCFCSYSMIYKDIHL